MRVSGLLQLSCAMMCLTACTARKPTEADMRQVAAECSILDAGVWIDARDEQKIWMRFRKKYWEEYRKMTAPGYDFRTTTVPKLREKLLIVAMSRCRGNLKCKDHFLYWARDRRGTVRTLATISFVGLAMQNPEHVDELYKDVLAYLRDDLPSEYLATFLASASYYFGDKVLPEGVLKSLGARPDPQSAAACYLKEAVRKARARGNRLPPELEPYPPHKIEVPPGSEWSQ